MTVLGYFADLLCQEAPDGETVIDRRWITADERTDLIGDGRVIAATFVPLIATQGVGVAWLVHTEPGPFVTPYVRAAAEYRERGYRVDSLRFGGLDPRET